MKSKNIILLILVILLVACGQQTPQDIGSVNGRSISAEDFIFSYETSPRSATSAPKDVAYDQVLDRLIERILLAQESQRRGLHNAPETARELKYLEDAAIRRELFREKIRKTTVVSEDDVRQAFALAQRTLWIQHIQLDSSLSEKPEIWNSAWTHTPINPALKTVEIPDLGMVNLVGWNDVDADLESTLYGLQLNEWTDPIQKSGHTHLFRLVNVETNQLVSENQFAQDQEHYHSALRKRLEHANSFAFVQETMQPQNLTIKGPVLEQLTQVLWTFNSVQDSLDGTPESEYKIEKLSLDDIGAAELAHFQTGILTTDDFRFYYQLNPQKLEANTKAGLRNKLVNSIGIYVRDIVFAELGRNEGLQQSAAVRDDYQYWQERLLAAKLEQQIQSEGNAEGESEASQALAELTKSLRNQAEISVNRDLLLSLRTSDEGLPRKIDFFTAYLN